MKQKWLPLLVALALITAMLLLVFVAGCATVPTGPAPIATSTKTVTANVAVAVPCILPEDIPKVPVAMELPEDATTLQKVALLASYAKDLQRYVDIADSLIQICAKVTP